MRCPSCSERDTRVVDSRDLDDAATIRRRRECPTCSSRFTTYERVESARLSVIKSNGERQEFDATKLARGLGLALWRRPVPADAATIAADEIEAVIRASGINEVPSSRIGEMAMDRLRHLDQIAYVRFLSVYQSLDDIEQLKREVDELFAARADEAPGQTSLDLVAAARRQNGRASRPGPAAATRRPTRR